MYISNHLATTWWCCLLSCLDRSWHIVIRGAILNLKRVLCIFHLIIWFLINWVDWDFLQCLSFFRLFILFLLLNFFYLLLLFWYIYNLLKGNFLLLRWFLRFWFCFGDSFILHFILLLHGRLEHGLILISLYFYGVLSTIDCHLWIFNPLLASLLLINRKDILFL